MAAKLTPKQQRFIEEYLIDLNATQAAIRAGYSAKTARAIGCENLAKPNIQEAIAKAKLERSEATKIDAEWVLRQAVELHRRCMQEIRPALHPKTRRQMKDGDGNLLFTLNAAAASRALELIGKHVGVGAFKDRLEVNADAEIIERLQAGRRRVGLPPHEDVKPVAKLPRPSPGPMPVEIEREPDPKPAKRKPKPKTSEDDNWEERTRGLPDGHWQDPTGLIRTEEGHVAVGIHRYQHS